MKIKFVGVGSAFTTMEYFQSNLLVIAGSGKKMLVDCGTDIRFSLGECDINDRNLNEEIDSIYISHLHSDHIGGMEWMAFQCYFSNHHRPKLFMEEHVMHEMWEHSLKGGLGCIEGKVMHLTDYFECQSIAANGSFDWEGIHFSLVKMPHVLTGYKNAYSYGLLMEETRSKSQVVFFTTDTQFQPEIIIKMSEKADVIFHDCETSQYKSIVHAHYDDLCTLPASVKRKMWLYHYQPHPEQNAVKDGFKGYVKKGQEFSFNKKT